MTPSLSKYDLRNKSACDSVLSREPESSASWAIRYPSSYLSDIILGKFRPTVGGTSVIARPATGSPIFRVIGFRTASKVRRIAARWVVTGMQHKGFVVGYLTMLQKVSNAMSKYYLSPVPPITYTHPTISSFIQEGGVRPAGISATAAVNSIVKMFYLFGCKLMSHGGSLLSAMSYPQPYQRCGGFYCTDYSIIERV